MTPSRRFSDLLCVAASCRFKSPQFNVLKKSKNRKQEALGYFVFDKMHYPNEMDYNILPDGSMTHRVVDDALVAASRHSLTQDEHGQFTLTKWRSFLAPRIEG
jgi:hypothetical protein